MGRPGVGVGGVGRPGVGVGGIGDAGLARFSGVAAHSTTLWSHDYMGTVGSDVRANFGYYGAFRPGWFGAYPGAWVAGAFVAGTAWSAATWPAVATYCSIPSAPIYYDYGNNVVYQNDNVYISGADAIPASQYAQEVAGIADQGRQADPPKDDKWQSLGVFALVQGTEKTSNNIFQLAANQAGILRGNYYDGLEDTTTPIYGAVDKKSQRAAWSIGDKKERVFETGFYNLTKDETPVLLHIGTTQTEQLMLVRVQQPGTPQTQTPGQK